MQRLKRLTAGLAIAALAATVPLATAWDAQHRYAPQPGAHTTSGRDHHAGHHGEHHHGKHHGHHDKHHGKHHGYHGHHGKHAHPHHRKGVIITPRHWKDESVIGHRTWHNSFHQKRPSQRHPEAHRYNRYR